MSELRISLDIKRVAEEKEFPVYFKVDGGRFDCDKTVKLTQNTNYKLNVTLKPACKVSAISILGQNADYEDVSKDESSTICKVSWNTNALETSKKNQRKNIPFVLEIEDQGAADASLQCKVYSVSDMKHSIWGTELHSIDLLCERKEGHMVYTVKDLSMR